MPLWLTNPRVCTPILTRQCNGYCYLSGLTNLSQSPVRHAIEKHFTAPVWIPRRLGPQGLRSGTSEQGTLDSWSDDLQAFRDGEWQEISEILTMVIKDKGFRGRGQKAGKSCSLHLICHSASCATRILSVGGLP